MLKILEASELPLESISSAPNLAPDERQKASRAEKRAAIDAALLANPGRTDADIAREVGVDPKTVKTRRENPEAGNSNGGNSSDGNFGGNLDAGNSNTGNSGAANSRPEPTTEPDPTRDASNDDDPDPHTLAGQQQIEMYFNKAGGLVLKQHNWPDEDSYVIVAEPYIGIFLDKLTDVCGIPTLRG